MSRWWIPILGLIASVCVACGGTAPTAQAPAPTGALAPTTAPTPAPTSAPVAVAATTRPAANTTPAAAPKTPPTQTPVPTQESPAGQKLGQGVSQTSEVDQLDLTG